MVFRTEIGLAALPVLGGALVDVLARGGAADEANRLHARLVQQEVDGPVRAVHDADDARREASLAREIGEDQARAGTALGGLEDDAVAHDGGGGEGPEWYHCWEV